MGRVVAPVPPFANPEGTNLRRRITPGQAEWFGLRSGQHRHEVIPGSGDPGPLLASDGEAEIVANGVVIIEDELKPAVRVGAIALDPEGDAGCLIPLRPATQVAHEEGATGV